MWVKGKGQGRAGYRGIEEGGEGRRKEIMEENGMLWQGRERMGWERDMAVSVCVVYLWKGQWIGKVDA